MAVAPKVNYYRLAYNDSLPTPALDFYDEDNDVFAKVPATFLDFGIVDAGDDAYEVNNINDDESKLVKTLKSVRAYAIYNNNADSSNDVSDMQNTKLSVVCNEAGKEGNTEGTVYYSRWIQVLVNNEQHSDGWTSLGKYPGATTPTGYNANECLPNFAKLAANLNSETDGVPVSGTADTLETKKELTALASGTDPGTIKGTKNNGTLNDTDNFAKIPRHKLDESGFSYVPPVACKHGSNSTLQNAL